MPSLIEDRDDVFQFSSQFKSNRLLHSLYYAEAWNEFAGPISASLRPGDTAPFEEMSQQRQAVGNTVSDLTGPIFKPQTSRSRDERVTARPTGWLTMFVNSASVVFLQSTSKFILYLTFFSNSSLYQ